MARIFISYKRVDKERVFKIKDQIEAALGEKCWIDLDGIESDAQFKNVIIRAINECEIVLFMYSKVHSNIIDFEKDWTMRELNFARKKNKRIVFVNLDGSPLTDEFEFDYGTQQQVDALSSSAIDRLVKDLRKWKSPSDSGKPEVGNGSTRSGDSENGVTPPPSPPTYFAKYVKYGVWLQTAVVSVILIICICLPFFAVKKTRSAILMEDILLMVTLAGMIWTTLKIKSCNLCRWSFFIWDAIAIALLCWLSSEYYDVSAGYNPKKMWWGYRRIRDLGYCCKYEVPLVVGVFGALYVIHNACVLMVMYSRVLWEKLAR